MAAFSILILSFLCQNPAQIVDCVTGAFDGALAAGQADGLVDVGEIVRHGDRAGRADLLTDAAADAADLTHPPRVLAGIFVGALDDDGVCAFVDADEFARAFAHAFAAGDALVLVDLGHAVLNKGAGREVGVRGRIEKRGQRTRKKKRGRGREEGA